MKDISIIVVSYNTQNLTLDCVGQLKGFLGEIFVVDNASIDGSASALREWSIKSSRRHVILNQENLGFAKANNQACLMQSMYCC